MIIFNRRTFKKITKYIDCMSNMLVIYNSKPSAILCNNTSSNMWHSVFNTMDYYQHNYMCFSD